MTSKKPTDELVLGAEPRMDLLPPEVRLLKKVKATRRRLGGLLLAVLVLVGAGVGASSWYALQSQAELAAARERTTELLASQSKYSEVQKVQAALDTTLVARQFGASTEIDWKAYLAQVLALVPSTVTVDTLSIDSASPLVPYEQAASPLLNARVATIRILFRSPDATSVPAWLERMSTLPGYADSLPAAITRTDAGLYTVDFVLHVNEGAFSGRFATAEGK
ncbi:hypothetical protein [Cryobacterium sp. TMS1-13-1]|uniref:hypothetical protein n=1 Tax=Cryobacterium sp. TMS1-13-1 TaxID=1259220 RepID=UPI00106C86C2|nr:hypothetical protein [Cryobacterium sp. TMS1-13-1]TFD24858.1 hypothetical protein E3T31_00945 [Cryobacterium sp. TMS1-13-1]